MKNFGVEATEDVQNAMDEISGMSATVNPVSVVSSASMDMASAQPIRTDSSSVEALLSKYLPLLERSTSVNVSLEGDAQGLFRQVRKEVNKFTKSTGNSPFIDPHKEKQ